MADLISREAIERLATHEPNATPAPWHAANGVGVAALSGPDCQIYVMALSRYDLPETWARQRADAEYIAALRNAASSLIEAARMAHDLRDLVLLADAGMRVSYREARENFRARWPGVLEET